MTRALVIGVGNRDRGDDGAGLEVARRLHERCLPGTVVCERDGRASDLMEALRAAPAVVVVDAAVGGEPGTYRRLEAHRERIPAALLRTTTHSWGLAEAIELTRALGELPPHLVIYAVFGRAFETGEPHLSPEVESAVARVVDAILADEEAHSLPVEAAPSEP